MTDQEKRINKQSAEIRRLKAELKKQNRKPSVIPDPADKDTIAYLLAEVDRLQRELDAIAPQNMV